MNKIKEYIIEKFFVLVELVYPGFMFLYNNFIFVYNKLVYPGFIFLYNRREWFYQLFIIACLVFGTYKLWEWSFQWTVIDWESVSAYNSVKIPSAIIGIVTLCVVTLFYDLISPGNWHKKASEDAQSAAIVLAALIVGISLILAK